MKDRAKIRSHIQDNLRDLGDVRVHFGASKSKSTCMLINGMTVNMVGFRSRFRNELEDKLAEQVNIEIDGNAMGLEE